MSDLLDPSSEFHLRRIGVATGWRCLEIGAGNGSLSQWLAQRVGPTGHVIASDIHTDLMIGIADRDLEVRKFDVVHDEPPDACCDQRYCTVSRTPRGFEQPKDFDGWLTGTAGSRVAQASAQ